MAKKIILTSILTVLAVALLLGIIFRWPLMLVYAAVREPLAKEKKILYYTDHKALESELVHFAAIQRWGNPDKKTEPDFFYGDDQRLPPLLKELKPSWVEIRDDRVDVGCGGAVFDKSRNFGISVWRNGLSGWGTKELRKGMWFYSDDKHIPSRFAFPW